MNSISVSERSEIGVRCVICCCFVSSPFSLISSIIFSLASLTFNPFNIPAFLFISPSCSIAILGINFISRKNWMSVKSPIEHIIAIPVPLSVWAEGCDLIGISSLNIGEIAVLPSRCLYLLSSGLKIIIPHVAINSGRVVPIIISSFVSLTFHLMSLKVDCISLYSISESAIVV